ncbi:CreA family protein [Agrobacterium rubi]|nr:CreA family protein [Agrobacterium rubi]NTF24642.1 CreA family protein [Agrobacterium rubi]
MKRIAIAVAGLLALSAAAVTAEEIGSVDTIWKMIGANDKIVVEAYDDPGVAGVTCHVSRAQTGGIFSTSSPNEASIACRQVGPIDWDVVTKLPGTDDAIFKEKTSLLFKELKVARMIDVRRRTLVYLVYTTELWDGSPKNVISSVPVMPWH